MLWKNDEKERTWGNMDRKNREIRKTRKIKRKKMKIQRKEKL